MLTLCGYGFKLVKDPSIEGVKEILEKAPETQKMFRDDLPLIYGEIKEEDVCSPYYCQMIGEVLAMAIGEIEDISIAHEEDGDGYQHIVFPLTFPWWMDPKDHELTEEKLREIFSRYTKTLFPDLEIEIGYQHVDFDA